MGMFDEIIVPKSYLRGILDKKDESLFDTNHKFQTKDLENTLRCFSIKDGKTIFFKDVVKK